MLVWGSSAAYWSVAYSGRNPVMTDENEMLPNHSLITVLSVHNATELYLRMSEGEWLKMNCNGEERNIECASVMP